MANGIGNAVGVRHTESSLIVWSGEFVKEAAETQKTETASPIFNPDQFYDAGDKGCAAGPMDEISCIMRKMSPGQTLEIHATDAAVSIDIAAWCRMTGHQLVEERDSHFLVQHQ